MNPSLLSLLSARLEEENLFREIHQGAQSSSHFPFGDYQVLIGGHVPELWHSLAKCLERKEPLVLLPPSSPLEREVLLRQLPPSPPENSLLVLFTSGTSGEPKAVFHSEASLLTSASQLIRAFPGHLPTLCLLSPWQMGGVAFHLLLPLLRSGKIFFSRSSLLDWSLSAPELLTECEIEWVFLNPFLLEMLLRAGISPRWNGNAVSLTAPLKQALRLKWQEAMNRNVREIYGMTEAAGPVLLDGKTLGAELRIQDRQLELRGSQLHLGYSREGKFSPRPEWFPTGDFFERHGDFFTFETRLRDLIDVGGRKISPLLIEEVMEQAPGVAECMAFPVTLASVERPGLLFVRKPETKSSAGDLHREVESWIQERLSQELRPKFWKEVPSLPLTRLGKPDRAQAAKLYSNS